jgi:hypothetical protein
MRRRKGGWRSGLLQDPSHELFYASGHPGSARVSGAYISVYITQKKKFVMQ